MFKIKTGSWWADGAACDDASASRAGTVPAAGVDSGAVRDGGVALSAEGKSATTESVGAGATTERDVVGREGDGAVEMVQMVSDRIECGVEWTSVA